MRKLWLLSLLLLIGEPLLIQPTYAATAGVFTGDLSANTAGTEGYIVIPDGKATVSIYGTGGSNFGGGTAILQKYGDAGTLKTITGASWTADIVNYKLEAGGCLVLRVQLSGATTPSIHWEITPAHYQITDQSQPNCANYRP